MCLHDTKARYTHWYNTHGAEESSQESHPAFNEAFNAFAIIVNGKVNGTVIPSDLIIQPYKLRNSYVVEYTERVPVINTVNRIRSYHVSHWPKAIIYVSAAY